MRVTTLIHGFLGTVLIAGLTIALWQTIFAKGRSLKAMRVNLISMTAVALALDLLGDIVYTRYRLSDPASARSIILTSDRSWVHTILMEAKEHAAHFIPLILAVVVVLLLVYEIRSDENRTPRRIAALLVAISLIYTLGILFMGALATWVAPV